jgi:hypothetical protein
VEARMPERWQQVKRWRDHAAELYHMAQDTLVPSAKDELQLAARGYERMADELERKLNKFGVQIPDEIGTPQLRELYEWWCARQIDGKPPSERQIDPLDLEFLHGNLLIIDISDNPPRFRFRLFGSELVARLSHDWTGKPLDTYPDVEFRRHLQRVWEEAVTVGRPIANTRRMRFDGRFYRYDGLILPLSTDGEKIDALLVGVVQHGDWSALDW